jgi:hypothetical protein
VLPYSFSENHQFVAKKKTETLYFLVVTSIFAQNQSVLAYGFTENRQLGGKN